MKTFWELFTSFFKTGLFTFGGGYAMLPLLKTETVSRRKWLSEDELLDYFSIGQCTPGIIAINVSTFCGYKVKGISGAVVATTAMVLPSLIIITLVALALNHLMAYPMVSNAFAGIRLGVTALLGNLILDMAKKLYTDSQYKILHTFIFTLCLCLIFWADASAVLIVIIAAVSGFIPYIWQRKRP